MNHNQNAHFDSMLKGWMGLGHESSFKANELLKEIEQTPLQASAFYESASSRVGQRKLEHSQRSGFLCMNTFLQDLVLKVSSGFVFSMSID
jgi:hypothetical protein